MCESIEVAGDAGETGVSGDFGVPSAVFSVLAEVGDVGELGLQCGMNSTPVVKVLHCYPVAGPRFFSTFSQKVNNGTSRNASAASRSEAVGGRRVRVLVKGRYFDPG